MLFANQGPASVIVTLHVPKKQRRVITRLGLPRTITVRLVRVLLDDGTVEVLVTSLLEETRYPTPLFKELYHFRWGIETLYDRIKNLLCLENFSGTTVEAVKQDFYATIYLCGLEAVLTEDAKDQNVPEPIPSAGQSHGVLQYPQKSGDCSIML